MNVLKITVLSYFICCSAIFVSESIAKEHNTLVVFSGRKEPLIKPVIDLFEKQTGINVVLKTGKSAILGQQILQELPNPSADVFIAKESGSLEFLRIHNAFTIFESENTRKVPKHLRSGDGTWVGVSGRSRAVIYNKDLIKDKDLPSKLEDLLDPRYKGKIAAVNSGNESFIAWVSALRIKLGEDETRRLLKGLKKNKITLVSKSHTDVRKSVGRGEFSLGLINHYYYHLQKKEVDRALRNVGIIYLDQEEGGRGELINVSGAGIIKNAKHIDQAKQFIDFLVSPAAQYLFASVNFEYPLIKDVPVHQDVLDSMNCQKSYVFDCLSSMGTHLDQLGSEIDNTLRLLDEVDWN